MTKIVEPVPKKEVATTLATKHKAVNRAVNTIKKRYDLDCNSMVIAMASDLDPPEKISTGIIGIDAAMDGGFSTGRFFILSGQVGSGKTTLAYNLCGSAQKVGKTVVFINAEERFEPEWAEQQGVDIESLIVISPRAGTSAEAVLDIFIEIAKDRAADLIVIDSVTSLSGHEEMEKQMDASTMALTPRILSKFFRKAVGITAAAKVCGVFITQVRETMSVYSKKLDSITGGNALKHYAHYILNTSATSYGSSGFLTKDEGFIMNVEFLKATGKGHGTKVKLDFKYDEGILPYSDALNAAIAKNIITLTETGTYIIPSTITGGDELKVRGFAKTVNTIKEKGWLNLLHKLVKEQ